MTRLLIENMELVAGAPNGVDRLRELILDLAVRGCIVEQDSSDENAERLVERIAVERAVVPGGARAAARAQRAESSVGELPPGWVARSFAEVLSLEYGQNLTKSMRSNSGSFPVYGSNGIVGSHDEPNVKSPCIVVGRKGSAGALHLSESEGCWVTDVAYFCVPSRELSLEYVYLLFQTLRLSKLSKGIKPGLTRKDVLPLVLRIPPRREQERIVQRVKELMAVCDALARRHAEAAELHTQVVEAFLKRLNAAGSYLEFSLGWSHLEAHFDELFVSEESLDALERSIHTLAIRGKLVPQDSEDQPALALMRELRRDRMSWLQAHQGNDSECRLMITKLAKHGDQAELPFDVPASWQVVPLIDCCRVLADCHNKTAPYVAGGVPLIRTSNVRDGEFRLEGLKFVSEATYELWAKRCPPAPGDIIFTREAPMGEAAIIPAGARFCLGQRTMLVRPMHEYILNDYLLLVLTETGLLERASSVGSTVQHLRVGDVERLPVPVPPLSEQRRIVERVQVLRFASQALRQRLRAAEESSAKVATALASASLQLEESRILELAV